MLSSQNKNGKVTEDKTWEVLWRWIWGMGTGYLRRASSLRIATFLCTSQKENFRTSSVPAFLLNRFASSNSWPLIRYCVQSPQLLFDYPLDSASPFGFGVPSNSYAGWNIPSMLHLFPLLPSLLPLTSPSTLSAPLFQIWWYFAISIAVCATWVVSLTGQ